MQEGETVRGSHYLTFHVLTTSSDPPSEFLPHSVVDVQSRGETPGFITALGKHQIWEQASAHPLLGTLSYAIRHFRPNFPWFSHFVGKTTCGLCVGSG